MMNSREQYKRLLLFVANAVTLFYEFILFACIWYTVYIADIEMPFYRRGNWAVVGIYVLCMFFFTNMFGGYQIGLLKVADACLSHLLAVIAANIVAYFELCVVARDYVQVAPLAVIALIEIIVICCWIFVVYYIFNLLYPPHKLVVIYGDYSPEDFIAKINSRKDQYDVCGTISIRVGYEKLFEEIRKYEAVIIYDIHAQERNKILKFCFDNYIRTYVTPKVSDILISSMDTIHMFDTPLLLARNQGLQMHQIFVKRLMDIVLSAIGIVIASPFMLVIALLIKLYDHGPVFYRQVRLTKDGKRFRIIKFRSMRVNSEKDGARLMVKGDKRVTPVGRVLRNIHFDELPQLFNILKGDMSIVGPRPERPEIFTRYEEEIPEFCFRLKVKAGLTGYAQVYGKYNTTPYDKLKLDMIYIENFSLLMDLKLILMTVKILFQKENAEGVDKEQKTAIRNVSAQAQEQPDR
jgi:exopolysaccharide biosynthesis polyprenyl glycosylphosphotransferase